MKRLWIVTGGERLDGVGAQRFVVGMAEFLAGCEVFQIE